MAFSNGQEASASQIGTINKSSSCIFNLSTKDLWSQTTVLPHINNGKAILTADLTGDAQLQFIATPNPFETHTAFTFTLPQVTSASLNTSIMLMAN